MPPGITVIGLGPGDASLLTVAARDAIAAAPEVWLRTSHHPTVAGLPAGPTYQSFDDVYKREPSFDAVYEAIVTRVLKLGTRPDGVMYAVPGHPLFGEATVRALLLRAAEAGLNVTVLPGVSFVDTIATSLGLDPLTDGLLVLDALSLDERGRVLVPQRPTLIGQVYDRRAASQVKLALLAAYPPEHPVRVVGASGTGEERVVKTTIALLDHDESLFDHLATLYVAPLALVDDTRSFEGLRRIVAQLRNPDGGCPWDLEQTHETLKRYLLEEAYEALDALDAGDPHRLAEELGDLMMQVLLHAQVAEDAAGGGGEFVIEDVVHHIAEKLVRRHPHVFGDVEVEGAQEVLRNWEKLKRAERPDDDSLLDHVPRALPALAQAQSLQSRASKVGFGPPPVSADALARAVRDLTTATDAATAERLGELLFGIVALARARDVDAEEALRMTLRRFREDVGERERSAREAS